MVECFHFHHQLLSLSADRVRAEEERRCFELEVELVRQQQRQRHEERAKRKGNVGRSTEKTSRSPREAANVAGGQTGDGKGTVDASQNSTSPSPLN